MSLTTFPSATCLERFVFMFIGSCQQGDLFSTSVDFSITCIELLFIYLTLDISSEQDLIDFLYSICRTHKMFDNYP